MTKPIIAGKEPIAVDVEKDKLYSWCTCGKSTAQPFCDGAHKPDGVFKSQKWLAEKDETKYFCNCKQTKTPPFCDGSHKLL